MRSIRIVREVIGYGGCTRLLGDPTEMSRAAVAESVGRTLRHRDHAAGYPDPAAVRRVYADRALTPEHLVSTLR